MTFLKTQQCNLRYIPLNVMNQAKYHILQIIFCVLWIVYLSVFWINLWQTLWIQYTHNMHYTTQSHAHTQAYTHTSMLGVIHYSPASYNPKHKHVYSLSSKHNSLWCYSLSPLPQKISILLTFRFTTLQMVLHRETLNSSYLSRI